MLRDRARVARLFVPVRKGVRVSVNEGNGKDKVTEKERLRAWVRVRIRLWIRKGLERESG